MSDTPSTPADVPPADVPAADAAPADAAPAAAPARPDDTDPGHPPARVLVVDDDPHILEMLATTLRFAGYTVETAATGRQALTIAAGGGPDLLVLDVMLPDIDGFEIVRRLRDGGCHVPVVFLTARTGLDDRVTGLNLGGDDYVTKPFAVAEVIARVHTVLRRSRDSSQPPTLIRVADLELDDETRTVRRAGAPVDLSPTEYRLLHLLMANTGRVLSKAQILDHVWQYDFGGDPAVVEKFISNLRRKVDRTEPALIRTVRGIGYTVREPV
jgi:two-component system, OmpR family, response regulator